MHCPNRTGPGPCGRFQTVSIMVAGREQTRRHWVPCATCGGCGEVHCCDGEQAQPPATSYGGKAPPLEEHEAIACLACLRQPHGCPTPARCRERNAQRAAMRQIGVRLSFAGG